MIKIRKNSVIKHYFWIVIVISIIKFAFFFNDANAKFETVKVIDGDTIHIYYGQQIVKVRLKCADTPECGAMCHKSGKSQYLNGIDIGYQAYLQTKKWLIEHPNFVIKCKENDFSYGRAVCYITDGVSNLNHYLIENGYAVPDPRYCNKTEIALGEDAKAKKLGFYGYQEEWIETPKDFRRTRD